MSLEMEQPGLPPFCPIEYVEPIQETDPMLVPAFDRSPRYRDGWRRLVEDLECVMRCGDPWAVQRKLVAITKEARRQI